MFQSKLLTGCVFIFLLFAHGALAQARNGGETSKQEDKKQEILERSLPKKVRDFLANADIFEVFAQGEKKDGKLIVATDNLQYFPNFQTEVEDYNKRLWFLENFYDEVSSDLTEPDCYFPGYSVRATDGNKVLEVEISFSCKKFFVKGWLGEFSGRLSESAKDAEKIMNQILKESGNKF